jgi:hypothetical protein
LNTELRVLIIADPCPNYSELPKARDEGLAVLAALQEAQNLWGKDYTFHATVRIGSMCLSEVKASLAKAGIRADIRDVMKEKDDTKERVEPCEPLELLARIVSEKYDVVHYAGHGVFDERAGRMGWVFDRDCVFSAEEIFRVRQVPRLVFANACFSAAINAREPQILANPYGERRQRVGMAQAFFARGIQNFIGTGWEVHDDTAGILAAHFYRHALGIVQEGGKTSLYKTAPPATLGSALARAREAIMDLSTTWGAYQHYGHGNTKLLAFRNQGSEMHANGPGG